MNTVAKTLFPRVYDQTEDMRLVYFRAIPRRVRDTLNERNDQNNWLPIDALVRRYKQTSARLLASFDELHWEVWDSTVRCRYPITEMEEIKNSPPKNWKHFLERTLLQAHQVHVNESKLTEEFRDARSELCEDGSRRSEEEELRIWNRYQTYCRYRNTWAPYFRSNLDWDWDVAGSLRRLYKIDYPSQPANRHRPSTGISADGTMWIVTARDSRKELPAGVCDPGEIRYMTFSRDVKSLEVSIGAQTSVSDHDNDPEEQVFVDSTKMGLLDSRDASTNEIDAAEGKVATTASKTSSDSGSSLIVQECDFGSWSAQYNDGRPAISSAIEALEHKVFIGELACEAEGETTIFEMSAELTQVRSQTFIHNK